MPSLVILEPKLPEWKKADEDVFIGKDILELLSTSMYVEPLSMYREYVQNAADSLDAGGPTDHASSRAADVEITIDRQSRHIRITDYGLGLSSREFTRKLISIGGSAKRGTEARGFRGVGRLAGLAFCQELVFRSRQIGTDLVQELRWDSRKIRSLLRSAEKDINLTTIVAESVESRTIRATDEPAHFFQVELKNVIRHRDDRLLNSTVVSNYLAQVAPVPFHPDFEYGAQINAFLAESSVTLTPLRLYVEGEGLVYRPHRNRLNLGNGKVSEFNGLQTFVLQDRNGEISAASWILHHDYLGSVPKSALVSGWRMRSGNMQVGDDALIHELFPETRFNGWTIAETHVIDRRIIPNGRRDNYEHNAYFLDLLTRLTPFARDIANRCRTSSNARNAHQRIVAELDRLEESLAVAIKPRTPEFVVSAFRSDLERALPYLEKATSKMLFDTADGESLRSRIRRLQSKGEALSSRVRTKDALSDFPSKERSLLLQVIEAVHAIQGNTHEADRLVGKMLSRIRKKRSHSERTRTL
jgi:molecular chaperone HtpG